MTKTTNRQVSARLRALLTGTDARVTVLHGADGAVWSINGDRESAAYRVDTSPDFKVVHQSDWALFVKPR
jgi:hypothetical protein